MIRNTDKTLDKRKSLSTWILVLVLLTGVSLLLYPSFANWWNTHDIKKQVTDYSDSVSEISSENRQKLLEAAQGYNRKLLTERSRFEPTTEMTDLYNDCLDILGNGMMGYISIPSLRLELPIFHGTDDEVLDVGVGHLEGSSLPVGGIGTHCVLSGHRGLPSARLFTDLDKLTEGDIFMLYVLNETLTYEVDQILVVDPDETEALAIDENEDYCTLVTCTPYGINTQRLLVRGHRIANLSDGSGVSTDAFEIETPIVALAIASPVLLVLLILLMTGKGRRRKI
jgi:sortase A